MKACFISNKNEIELVLADGTRKSQKSHKLKELLLKLKHSPINNLQVEMQL